MASDETAKSTTLRDRSLVRVTGPDGETLAFLNDLVTNDLTRLDQGPAYAALLTPQGKYLCDFIAMLGGDGEIILDTPRALSASLVKRLSMYRLRRPLAIEAEDVSIAAYWGTAAAVAGAIKDPRHPALGSRLYRAEADGSDDYDAHRIGLGVPQAERDLIPNESYILEMGFETFNGVDFKKGCYVGQEIVARMKHKTELRKGLARVRIEGTASEGTEITTDSGKTAGTLHSVAGTTGLAYLRFDRADGALTAGGAKLTLIT